MFKNTYFEKVMTYQKLRPQCVLVLGIHFGVPKSFNHFNIVPIINCKVYYRENGGASSQVQVMWVQSKFVTQFGFICIIHLNCLICVNEVTMIIHEQINLSFHINLISKLQHTFLVLEHGTTVHAHDLFLFFCCCHLGQLPSISWNEPWVHH